jgi:hypothetical protein
VQEKTVKQEKTSNQTGNLIQSNQKKRSIESPSQFNPIQEINQSNLLFPSMSSKISIASPF